MRILHVNKFVYRRGGAEAYMQDVAELQVAAGHEVAFFGMAHPDNETSAYEGRFPQQMDFDPLPEGLANRMRAAGRMLYSSSARRGIDEVVADFRPDVVHLHNIYHQLSPSILRPLAVRGIPAVMTLHDYKLACPTYRFLDKGTVCEACVGGRFHQAVLRRCRDGSLGASAFAAVELGLHTILRSYGPIQRFVCPSNFIAGKMRDAGVYPDRLRVLSHFCDLSAVAPKAVPTSGTVVFAGRLSDEKGVDTLIRAVARLGDAHLEIAGEGPDREQLEALAATLLPGRATFHGRLERNALFELLRSATVAAVPSRWHENQPLAVLEAYGCGLPVVSTDLGGFPELVEEGVTGALVAPGDDGALARALGDLLADPTRAFAMGRAGRTKLEREFTTERHLQGLHQIYEEARACLIAA